MKPILKSLFLAYLIIFFSVIFLASPPFGSAFPVGDAFDRKQAAPRHPMGHSPKNDMPATVHPSLQPMLTDLINEPHPYPDYMKKFAVKRGFPRHYLELLKLTPVNKVQSKIFNKELFRNTHRIGVVGFENKTAAPFKDQTAGAVVAKQVSRQLQTLQDYTIIPPPQMTEDARLRIITGIKGGKPEDIEVPVEKKQEIASDLPYSYDKMDAVMIGAVTRYMDSHLDNRGQLQKNIASGVEFGAYLISTKTGDVIWGARYVGSQEPRISNLFTGKERWLNKEELSRSAMKTVLREFYEVKKSN